MAVEGACIIMKKSHVWVLVALLISAFIISIGFPWFFDNMLLGKAQSSNIDIVNWPGFMGSYAGGVIGGLLGSVATILGVYLTMNLQYEQAKDERRLSVRPALFFSKLEDGEKDGQGSCPVYDINVAKTKNIKTDECTLCFKTNNIGPGIIIKIMMNIPEINKDSAVGAEYSLTKCGETRYWKYDFNVTYDIDNKFFSYPLTLNFYYSDVFGNVYIQTAHACVQKSKTEEDGKEVESSATAWIYGEITEPKLVEKIPGYMRGWQN